ncbi:MAG: hypothetical protein V3V55_09370 [Rhodospirillales bacterium]
MGLLDRIFGCEKGKEHIPTEMAPEAAEKIIQAYGDNNGPTLAG